VSGRPYFTKDTFRFIKDLKAHNDRAWFAANKDRYEDHVKVPALRFIEEFAPILKKISPHFNASPRSLFRIYRDTRFAKDKSPFKTHVGIQFRHDVGRDVHAPGYYLHIEPAECFTGSSFEMSGERISRAPRGFDPEHPLVEDLKWKDFIAGCSLPDSFITSPDLPKELAKLFVAGTPFMEFLCKAVEVPF